MGTKLGTARTCDIRPVNAKPIPMAINAVTTGMMAARMAPKRIPRTMSANSTPSAVLSKDSCGWTFSIA